MKVVGYVRVSKDTDNLSPEAQEAKFRRWCEQHDHHLTIYSDIGISGARTKNRPGFNAAWRALKKGDVLMVYSLSRLSRSLRDILDIAEELRRKDVHLVSLSESVDTTTAMGNAFFQIAGVFNELERKVASERIRSSLNLKRTRMEKLGGKVPYGYDVSQGKLLPVQHEQTVIEQIKTRKANGCSLKKIADHLNHEKVPTKYGKEWAPAQIFYILKRA